MGNDLRRQPNGIANNKDHNEHFIAFANEDDEQVARIDGTNDRQMGPNIPDNNRQSVDSTVTNHNPGCEAGNHPHGVPQSMPDAPVTYLPTSNPAGWCEFVVTPYSTLGNRIMTSDPYLYSHKPDDGTWPANSGPCVANPVFPGAGFLPLGPFQGTVPSFNGLVSVTPQEIRNDRAYTKANGNILEINDALLKSWICPADLNDCICWWDSSNGDLKCPRPYRLCKQLRKWNGYRCPGFETCPHIHNIQHSCRFIASQHHDDGWPISHDKVCKMVLLKGHECTAAHDFESARQASHDLLSSHRNAAPPRSLRPNQVPESDGAALFKNFRYIRPHPRNNTSASKLDEHRNTSFLAGGHGGTGCSGYTYYPWHRGQGTGDNLNLGLSLGGTAIHPQLIGFAGNLGPHLLEAGTFPFGHDTPISYAMHLPTVQAGILNPCSRFPKEADHNS